MKKQKIANYIKHGILLLGISVLLWNCEKETDFVIQESKIKNSLVIRQSSFKEMIQDVSFKSTFENFEEEKEKYKRKQLNAKSSSTKDNDLYDFEIIKKKINIIKKDSLISYTFGLKRLTKSSGFFENLVLTVYKNGEAKAHIVRYIFKGNSQLKTVEEGFGFTGVIKTVELDFNKLQFQGKYEEDCVDNFLTLCTGSGQEAGACTGKPHIPSPQCLRDYSHCIGMTYVGRTCSGSFSSNGVSYDTTNPHSTGGGGGGGTSDNNDVNTSPVVYPCGDEVHGCTKKADVIATQLQLTSEERQWLRDQPEETILFYENFLATDSSAKAQNWAKGQIELETLFQDSKRNWKPKVGNIKNNPHLKYTHIDSDNANRIYFKMVDGSQVLHAGFKQKLTEAGDLIDKDIYDPGNLNDTFYYIKLPGEKWAEMLFDSKNLGDELRTLFALAGKDLGKNIGRYVLPIEDIKILITGKDFDGQDVSRWKAAGFLFLSVVPGGKALKVVSTASGAIITVVKLGGSTLVVDTVKYGLKVVTNNNIIKFLSQAGDEIARVVDGVMTFKYTGFGSDIVTTSYKTTTIIGRWPNQIENIWKTGLAKQGKNVGGMNILGNVPNGTVAEKWAFNKEWLNEAISRSDIIRVTANPLDINNVFHKLDNVDVNAFSNINNLRTYLMNLNPTLVNNLGYYGREIRHLFQNGYTFDSITKQFIK